MCDFCREGFFFFLFARSILNLKSTLCYPLQYTTLLEVKQWYQLSYAIFGTVAINMPVCLQVRLSVSMCKLVNVYTEDVSNLIHHALRKLLIFNFHLL